MFALCFREFPADLTLGPCLLSHGPPPVGEHSLALQPLKSGRGGGGAVLPWPAVLQLLSCACFLTLCGR